jgi:RNA polymerase sigma-70 factor, ECF subfamily
MVIKSNGGDSRAQSASGEIRLDEMVAAAKNGSNSALGRALSACRPQLLRAARLGLAPALRPLVGASDIVQDTFVNATKAFRVFRGERGNQFLNWLRRILANRIAQVGRHEGQRQIDRDESAPNRVYRTISTLIPSDEKSPSSIACEQENAELIRSGLMRLSAHDQLVLRLRFDDGLNFAEIGQRLELSGDAARMSFSRALERLRKELNLALERI